MLNEPDLLNQSIDEKTEFVEREDLPDLKSCNSNEVQFKQEDTNRENVVEEDVWDTKFYP